MTLEKLYKLLEMDGPEDMEYFEQFADLMEMDEDVPFDLFYMALSGVKPENAGELAENYFEDLSNAAPEDENDLVLLLDSLEENLMHLAEDIDDADARRCFAEPACITTTVCWEPVHTTVQNNERWNCSSRQVSTPSVAATTRCPNR